MANVFRPAFSPLRAYKYFYMREGNATGFEYIVPFLFLNIVFGVLSPLQASLVLMFKLWLMAGT